MKIRNPKYPFKQCVPWENCPTCFEDFSFTPCTNCGNGFEDEYIEVPSELEQPTTRIAELEAEVERTNDAFEQEHKACHDLIEKVIPNINKQLLSAQAENARLKAAVEYAETIRVENIAYFEKQLAASQAYVEQLRVAIDRVRSGAAALGLDRIFDIATEALALTNDTSALDTYVTEKVKISRDIDEKQIAYLFEERSLLTRQRDLAVNALNLLNIVVRALQSRDAHSPTVEQIDNRTVETIAEYFRHSGIGGEHLAEDILSGHGRSLNNQIG